MVAIVVAYDAGIRVVWNTRRNENKESENKENTKVEF